MGLRTREFSVVLGLVGMMAGCPDPVDPPGDADQTSDTAVDTADPGGELGPDSTIDNGGELDAAVEAGPPDALDTADGDTDEVDVPSELPEEVTDVPLDEAGPDASDLGEVADIPIGKPAAPGDLLITEIMVNPVGISDLAGEWIELRNLSGVTLDLADCLLTDDDGDSAVLVDGDGTTVFNGAFFVIARLADPALNGSVNADLATGDFTLSNAADEVKIVCGGEEVDAVRYTDAFPLSAGRSLSFDSGGPQTALDNDDAARWCPAPNAYQGANFGSPGALNPLCPDAPDGLDGCRLVGPVAAGVLTGANVDLAVEVLEGGVTDKTPFVDPFPLLTVELGHGPTGTDPVTASDWTWLSASAAQGWTNAAGDGYDRYALTLSPPIGTRSVVARASLDGGSTWSYCDLGGFTSDGSEAGSFTVHADPCAPNPCDAPPAANCVEDIVVGFEPVGACSVTDTFTANCVYAPAYQDCSEILGVCAVDQCVDTPPQPGEGDMVLTELMIQPTVDGDPEGEWFEVVNLSATDFNLAGCVLRDMGGESHDIAGPLVYVAAGGTLVFARDTAPTLGGVTPDYVYGDALTFDNDADELLLRCGSEVADMVAWDAAFFSAGATTIGGPGASIQLRPNLTSATANDDGAAWCSSATTISGGDAGTPGQVNPACADLTAVQKCRLESPAALTIDATLPLTVVGRIFQSPQTEATTGNDPSPDILAQAAIGPAGTDPSVDATGWVLLPAAPEDGYVDTGDTGHDSYAAVVDAPAEAGEYAIAFRFSADAGASWTFCDRNTGAGEDGSENGYQATAAGVLTVDVLDPCSPDPCDESPQPQCASEVATSYAAQGTCTASGAEFECEYLATVVDCAALGGVCVAGGCEDVAEAPTAGQVVFSEFMLGQGPGEGQWIELVAINDVVNLADCVVNAGDGVATFFGDTVLFPGERLVVAHSDVAGLSATATWGASGPTSGFSLEGALSLTCAGAVVDTVDLLGFEPPPQGRSLSLDPTLEDATSNDLAGSWCGAASSLPGGLFGSPGVDNAACPAALSVDGCRLQSPTTFVGFTGDSVPLEGRYTLAGVSDVSDAVDPSTDLLSECGVGPEATSPSASGWDFAIAAPVSGWDATAAADVGFDAFTVTVNPTLGGVSDAACRFSADRGRSWTYCDRDTGQPGEDGSENGYNSADAGKLSLFDPCSTGPCQDAPDDSCAGEVLTEYPSPGICTNNGAVVICDYPPMVTDCAEKGGTCDVAGCILPPAPALGELVLTEFMAAPEDGAAQWVEILNTSGGVLNLSGCALTVDGQTHVIDDDVLIPSDGYAVLASAADGSLGASWVFADLTLDTSSSDVALTCFGMPVDDVTYASGGDWPVVTSGRSSQLQTTMTDAVNNDLGTSWCLSVDTFGSSSFGTPGAASGECF